MGLHMCRYFNSILCKSSWVALVISELGKNVKKSHYKELAGDYCFFLITVKFFCSWNSDIWVVIMVNPSEAYSMPTWKLGKYLIWEAIGANQGKKRPIGANQGQLGPIGRNQAQSGTKSIKVWRHILGVSLETPGAVTGRLKRAQQRENIFSDFSTKCAALWRPVWYHPLYLKCISKWICKWKLKRRYYKVQTLKNFLSSKSSTTNLHTSTICCSSKSYKICICFLHGGGLHT